MRRLQIKNRGSIPNAMYMLDWYVNSVNPSIKKNSINLLMSMKEFVPLKHWVISFLGKIT